jgi:N-methylhydantoinase A
MTRYRVSADIGGTFTDFVVIDEQENRAHIGKVPTTPDDPALGVLNGLAALVPSLEEVGFVVHGTTVGLNAFLERKGAHVILVMTAGLSDSYTIARGNRDDLYALQYRKPQQLVMPRDVHEVRERLRWNGAVYEPLHEEDFEPIIQKIEETGIEAVAICFVHSFAYPRHELLARDVLKQALPHVSVTLSHEIAREWREFERASSAVMNAYIAPKVESYLLSLEDRLQALGGVAKLYVMQSSGGVMSVDAARQRPVLTLLSGPVGGSVGGIALSEAMNRPNLLCIDMGGTSFDVSLVVDGHPTVTTETELEGLPLLMSIVDIHTIGAGGGSLAWLEAGALRVGPQSAGAIPGPVAYGRGGTQPTVTDANLFLKRLGTGSLLAGRMTLDAGAAANAIQKMAQQVGLDDTTLAEGILSIANARMADAMRTITVEQGIDPRDFSLVAFGGAGPMHAVWLAKELDIGEIIVPRFPGTFSAWGMLHTDVRYDLTQNFYFAADSLDPDQIETAYQVLEGEGNTILRDEGFRAERISFVRTADMRYIGQEYSVNVRVNIVQSTAIADAFHKAHDTRYGHSTPGAPVEFVNLRVAAFGHLDKGTPPFAFKEDQTAQPAQVRDAIFDGRPERTPVLWRDQLSVGSELNSPVIIEEESATTVVPPGWHVRIDKLGSLIINNPS